jgi:hypothetical protein
MLEQRFIRVQGAVGMVDGSPIALIGAPKVSEQ